MKLTLVELTFYKQNGYLIKHNVFSKEEVLAFRRAAEDAAGTAKCFVNKKCSTNKAYTIDGNRFVDFEYNGKTTVQFEHDKANENDVIRVIEPIHHFDNIFENLVDDKKITTPMEQILNRCGDGISLWTSKLNLKRPHGSEFQYHQDSPYWLYDCKHSVDLLPNVIIYFDDATIENGALKIIEKSHIHGILPGRTNEKFEYPGFFTDTNSFDPNDAVPIVAKAGSVCFFNPHTVHGSMRNLTNQSRRAAILTYQPLNFPMLKNGCVRNCAQGSDLHNSKKSIQLHATKTIKDIKDVSKL
jgi:ectoine hydroxylase-related dioxygenase (phytanoyl-CoA dioxygenase family)